MWSHFTVLQSQRKYGVCMHLLKVWNQPATAKNRGLAIDIIEKLTTKIKPLIPLHSHKLRQPIFIYVFTVYDPTRVLNWKQKSKWNLRLIIKTEFFHPTVTIFNQRITFNRLGWTIFERRKKQSLHSFHSGNCKQKPYFNVGLLEEKFNGDSGGGKSDEWSVDGGFFFAFLNRSS